MAQAAQVVSTTHSDCPVAEILTELAPLFTVFQEHEGSEIGKRAYESIAAMEQRIIDIQAQSDLGALMQISLSIAELDLIHVTDMDPEDVKRLLERVRGMLASAAEHLTHAVGRTDATPAIDWYRSAGWNPIQ